MKKRLATGLVAAFLLTCLRPAVAIPIFAHRYGFSCQQCHTVVPRLNAFGAAFFAAGYRLPIGQTRPVLPIAVKVNLQYSSEPEPAGLPKVVADEIELLTGGSIKKHLSYFVESYVVDGGRPGAARDVRLNYLSTPNSRGGAIRIAVGQFTLPLPVDPETFRETQNHYAIFDQTVGANPFNLFDPHIGVDLAFGSPSAGLDLHLLALKGHDKQSGLPTGGLDTMFYVQRAKARLTLSMYGYQGRRPLRPIPDSFFRQGFGANYRSGKLVVDAVLQNGNDSSSSGFGFSDHSSGGFLQLRWAFDPALFALARYDGTHDSTRLYRSLTLTTGRRLTQNTRLTVDDVITHAPLTKHTLTAGLLLAY